jgi:hypothetical protein
MNDVISNNFHQNVDRYMPGCAASLLRNKHMNQYDGETFNSDEVGTWLHRYVNQFATAYHGGMTVGDVIYAAVDSAKKFLPVDKLPYKRTTTEAIIVDFLNYMAACSCMDLALYTSDMR